MPRWPHPCLSRVLSRPALVAAGMLSLTVLATASTAHATPTIDVLTMGASEHPFELFGHAAICVTSEVHPQGTCYNYGTADFRRQELGWEVLRGEATFWVEAVPYARVLRSYRRADRTIYRQRLELPPEQAQALADALDRDALPEHRNYNYNHFFDNCTTRIRDRIDLATHGRLSAGSEALWPSDFRELVRQGFATSPEILLFSELTLGRSLDRPTTTWEAMFLPDVFRQQIEARFGAQPQVIYLRTTGEPTHEHEPSRHQMLLVLTGLGLVLGASSAFGLHKGHRWPLAITGTVLGLVAVPIWFLAVASPTQELRLNELLLLLTPLDFALIGFRHRSLPTWLMARSVQLLLVGATAVVGLLSQPLLPFVVLVGASLLPPTVIALRRRQAARGAVATKLASP